MRSVLIILSLMTSFFASADAPIIYKIGDLRIGMVRMGAVVVSKGCQDGPCLALMKAKEYYNADVPEELLTGGKNPASVRCKHLMGGEVIIAVDFSGNRQSLCHFKDDSYLR